MFFSLYLFFRPLLCFTVPNWRTPVTLDTPSPLFGVTIPHSPIVRPDSRDRESDSVSVGKRVPRNGSSPVLSGFNHHTRQSVDVCDKRGPVSFSPKTRQGREDRRTLDLPLTVVQGLLYRGGYRRRSCFILIYNYSRVLIPQNFTYYKGSILSDLMYIRINNKS